MARVDIRLNHAAMRDILRSPRVLADLERRAERIASAAGPGHEVESEVGRNRARAAVITSSFEAMHREATSRSLTVAMDAGRG
jgi:hypothetical protein